MPQESLVDVVGAQLHDPTLEHDVFIVYAKDDEMHAAKLYEHLTTEPSLRVFFDKKTLSAGQTWDVVLGRAVVRARLVVVLVSGAWETSHYAPEELARAIKAARGRPNQVRVVPVYLTDAPAPYGTERLASLRVGHGEHQDGTLGEIARRLREVHANLKRGRGAHSFAQQLTPPAVEPHPRNPRAMTQILFIAALVAIVGVVALYIGQHAADELPVYDACEISIQDGPKELLAMQLSTGWIQPVPSQNGTYVVECRERDRHVLLVIDVSESPDRVRLVSLELVTDSKRPITVHLEDFREGVPRQFVSRSVTQGFFEPSELQWLDKERPAEERGKEAPRGGSDEATADMTSLPNPKSRPARGKLDAGPRATSGSTDRGIARDAISEGPRPPVGEAVVVGSSSPTSVTDAHPIDCEATVGCRESGLCTFQGGRCLPGDDEDCEQSSGCARARRCVLNLDRCIEASDAFCAEGWRCQDSGACSAVSGRCVATSSRDCARILRFIAGQCFGRECKERFILPNADRGPIEPGMGFWFRGRWDFEDGRCVPNQETQVMLDEAREREREREAH